MRLVCPNCAAQYEIDASLIPDGGTDVQCSACNHVWFEAPEGAALPRATQPAPASERGRAPAAESARTAAAPEPTPEAAPDPQPAAPPPRDLDPAVADVLREEAAFEEEQRARDAAPAAAPQQEQLGLLGDAPAPDSGRGSAGKLPDIDDISATLEPVAQDRGGATPELPQTPRARRRGFLAGLGLPVGTAGLMAAVYAFAPQLADWVPALGGVLGRFVGMVDQARLALAGLLGG